MNKTVNLVDFGKEEEQWIKNCESSHVYRNSFESKLNDDYDIEFKYTMLVDYHNCIYEDKILIVILPKSIKRVLMRIEERAIKNMQKDIKKLLGVDTR
jgi:hypothetical protein